MVRNTSFGVSIPTEISPLSVRIIINLAFPPNGQRRRDKRVKVPELVGNLKIRVHDNDCWNGLFDCSRPKEHRPVIVFSENVTRAQKSRLKMFVRTGAFASTLSSSRKRWIPR